MKFNSQQIEALALADAGHSLLIQGAVGTGKTTTVTAIIAMLKAKGLKVAVTGSTGVAAKNIKGEYPHSDDLTESLYIVPDYIISAVQ